jgi:hypothetical protein
MGSISVVLLATQKPVWRGEEADGCAVSASIVLEAACLGISIVSEVAMIRTRISWKAYGEHVFDAKADPILHRGVFGQDTAGGCVSYDSRRYFFEDAIRHGVAQEAADVDFI